MIKYPFNFDFINFKQRLGYSESRNNYSTNTGNGAYGYYQFTAPTIDTVSNELGINVSIDEFLKNPSLQDVFYFQYINDILNYIVSKGIFTYIGKPVTGKTNGINTNITIYGLVAGGWLGGPGNIYNYVVLGQDKSDGATFISDYIAKFSNQIGLMQ